MIKRLGSPRGRSAAVAFAALAGLIGAGSAYAQLPPPPQPIGETPAITKHLDQADIAAGKYSADELFALGEKLFEANFNKLDGRGRPAATGNGVPTKRSPIGQPEFLRTSGTDANSCAGCHSQPRVGGGGDFVANVFVLAQILNPVTESVNASFSNERNTLGMMGSGPIEALGREMTDALFAIRSTAIAEAKAKGGDVTKPLVAKGVSFGSIKAHPDSTVDTSGVQGVDGDLVIKPFHQKGVVRSIREFSVNAFNHHHGMEAVERFGFARTGTNDFDEDGVPDEMTVGDITAATLYQALLNTPGQVIPRDHGRAEAVEAGEERFTALGCASCHVPQLTLNNAVFCEPYARNTPGTFADTSQSFCFDMTRDGERPRLDRAKGGTAVVNAYTDLKRHVICDPTHPHYCNEQKIQAGVPLDQFITRKLWDVGNSSPYGHRGDLSTITEAILAHGGEADASRTAFEAASPRAQAEVVEFLKSLQILPPGSPRTVRSSKD